MKYYVLKYRLPMSHSSTMQKENSHYHVIEITVQAEYDQQTFIEFQDMERVLNQCLDPYKNQYLNEMEEFDEDTSIENIAEVFYEKLSQAFANEGWNLTKIEVGENPLRVYIIQTNHI